MEKHGISILASVVVPVYNKETYLDTCFKTLDRQTLSKEHFEVIFIDDGSEDSSPARLDEFVNQHSWAHVIHQDNGGVCAARNAGIDEARGRYIFYLDPDDELSPNVLEDVSAFFEAHYDEVDLVTYKIKNVDYGVVGADHVRYTYLTHDDVYSINEGNNCYICQTTMNICVKNLFARNHHFNFESSNGIIFHEDEQYITEVLLVKNRIGYVSQAEYFWKKNSQSTTHTILNPYYIFDNTMLMYEKLVEYDGGKMSRYVQALFVNNLGWKMRANAAIPTHVQGEAFDRAKERLAHLLDFVDNDILFGHPNMDPHHALYFMGLRTSSQPKLTFGPGGVVVSDHGEVVRVDKNVELCLLRTRAHHNKLDLLGIVKTPPFFKYLKDPDFHLYANLSNSQGTQTSELKLTESGESYYMSHTKVSEFRTFRFTLPLNEACDLRFNVVVEGISMPCYLTRKHIAVTFSDSTCNSMICGDYLVFLHSNEGILHVECKTTKQMMIRRHNLRESLDLRVRLVRAAVAFESARLHKLYDEVWIYTDAPHRLDNAWKQFCYDAGHDDRILRFYVANGVQIDNVPRSRHCKVIAFGSKEHRILHWLADRRLFSDITNSCICPWDIYRARPFYADLDNAERIYLQHGVLWAHIPWYYSYDKAIVDREVVSTQFEIDNLTANYGFRETDLIPTGMARYDFIEHERPSQKRVLLCPSWRSYLVGELTSEGRAPLTRIFLESTYYKKLMNLLHDERLCQVLNHYGYQLDLKLHPNFACYKDLFSGLESPIQLIDKVEDESSYAIIITDYSSYSFDFVYINRAIIYYIPDEDMFRAGLSNYNKLDMDLRNAMGEYAANPEEVIDALDHVLAHGGHPWGRYAQKEKGFFLYYDNNQRERLYRILLKS